MYFVRINPKEPDKDSIPLSFQFKKKLLAIFHLSP